MWAAFRGENTLKGTRQSMRINPRIRKIAKEQLGIDNLESQEAANIRAALQRAFEIGRASELQLQELLDA
jgi:hypothetical protein